MKLGNHISPADLLKLSQSFDHVALDEEAIARVQKCFDYVQDKIERTGKPIYGVNTGFGSLCNTLIDRESLKQLQVNLLLSHACGMGDKVPNEIVRIMLLIKVLSLSKGHSGVQIETIDKLLNLYNQNLLPVVYEQGSLGASGDLAPLAHLSLPLIGQGNVHSKGEEKDASFLYDPSYSLKAKEGLALINGTQFMAAYGVHCVVVGKELVHLSNRIAALSADAFHCRLDGYLAQSHTIRNQHGQQVCAEEVLNHLTGSEIAALAKEQVQDPYSYRCIPQVHGASLDVLLHAETIFDNEINAVTDNPNVFPDEDLILSAGNFHGQTLAIQLDTMAIALAELANISERRIYKLVSGERGLPPFLIENAGLNSGFMIPQYTAASIVSQNKQYCSPASTDSIVSSNGQEDHVSMGANAATKCLKVLNNTITVLSIELMVASQALDYRRPGKTSTSGEKLHTSYRSKVPFIKEDTFMHPMMQSSRDYVLGMLS